MASAYGADYRGRQHVLQFSELTVYTTHWQPATISRTRTMIRRADPECYHLSLVKRGTVVTTLDGRQARYGLYGLRTHLTYRRLTKRAKLPPVGECHE
ncbi:hypothetical protein [Streptomyces sp. 5-10]|uniref:hypothetical protein n=1 Tax=Streptomyces sp. 5-10 TaxID=878925 RepID=UPI00168B6BAA|nr:hypothetical protein [Streptomyces sp. 5-10]MBD3008510.1 hypothetical protein [Streptomyces sp. 5-10]